MLSCEVLSPNRRKPCGTTSWSVIVGIAIVASLTWGAPALGAGHGRATAGNRPFHDIVQRAGPAALRPRDALSALLLVSRIPGGVRAGAAGRSPVRHRLLGDRAQPALEPARPAAQGQPRARAWPRCRREPPCRRRPRASGTTSEALLAFYTDHDTVAHGARVQRYLEAMEALAQRYPGDDEAQIGYAITLNARRVSQRQDLCEPAQGGRHPGADLQASAAPSRRRPLSDPPVRLSAHRGQRARRGQAVCRDRAGGAARPAHAVTHLHARGPLEGVDRHQRAPRRAPPRPATSPTTSCTRWTTMVYAHLQLAQDTEARAAVDEMVGGWWLQPESSAPDPTRSRPARPATWSNGATGPAPPGCARRKAGLPMWTPSRGSPARWARRVPATRRPPGCAKGFELTSGRQAGRGFSAPPPTRARSTAACRSAC